MLILYITLHVEKHNRLTVLFLCISPSHSPSLYKLMCLLCEHNVLKELGLLDGSVGCVVVEQIFRSFA